MSDLLFPFFYPKTIAMKNILIAVAMMGFLTACSNNSTEGNNEDHPHPSGAHEHASGESHDHGEHDEQEDFVVGEDTTTAADDHAHEAPHQH
jgi:hypothetical protein